MRALTLLVVLSLAACSADPAAKLAGPFPTGANLNPNGTVPLAGSGNYVYNRATGSYSRFSSDPRCADGLGEVGQGCSNGYAGGDGAGSSGGK